MLVMQRSYCLAHDKLGSAALGSGAPRERNLRFEEFGNRQEYSNLAGAELRFVRQGAVRRHGARPTWTHDPLTGNAAR
jgi:hypothetical protein